MVNQERSQTNVLQELNPHPDRPIRMSMNRRFFERSAIRANGELFWATKTRFGKITNHHEYFHTEDLSVDGARVVLPVDTDIPSGSHPRIKFGLESCTVEVRGVEPGHDHTILRLVFLNPTAKFVATIEQWLPVDTARRGFSSTWTGVDESVA